MFKKIKEFLQSFGKPEEITKGQFHQEYKAEFIEEKPTTKIQLFKDKNKKWRFRLVSSNHKILCSSEAYSRKCYCRETAELIRKSKMCVVEE